MLLEVEYFAQCEGDDVDRHTLELIISPYKMYSKKFYELHMR
jgi:hypothetical protein